MTPDPPNYGPDSIRKLALPDAVPVGGAWRSVWKLAVRARLDSDLLASLAREVTGSCSAEVALVLRDGEVEMELHASDHYLDVEGFMTIDCVLRRIDAALGIETINGSARDLWRTFRG